MSVDKNGSPHVWGVNTVPFRLLIPLLFWSSFVSRRNFRLEKKEKSGCSNHFQRQTIENPFHAFTPEVIRTPIIKDHKRTVHTVVVAQLRQYITLLFWFSFVSRRKEKKSGWPNSLIGNVLCSLYFTPTHVPPTTLILRM